MKVLKGKICFLVLFIFREIIQPALFPKGVANIKDSGLMDNLSVAIFRAFDIRAIVLISNGIHNSAGEIWICQPVRD